MQVSILTLILSLVNITCLSRSNTLVLKSTDVTYSYFYYMILQCRGLFNSNLVVKFWHTYRTFLQGRLGIVVQHRRDCRNKRKYMVTMLVKFHYNYHNNRGSSHSRSVQFDLVHAIDCYKILHQLGLIVLIPFNLMDVFTLNIYGFNTRN